MASSSRVSLVCPRMDPSAAKASRVVAGGRGLKNGENFEKALGCFIVDIEIYTDMNTDIDIDIDIDIDVDIDMFWYMRVSID